MERPIVAFALDPDAEWVAALGCGHRQHLRHNPPFTERPWVRSAKGRAGKVGQPLDCPRCDRGELPDGYEAQNRTPVFDRGTTPPALQKRHTTKPGVWALIHVQSGEVSYHVHAPFHRVERLVPGTPGVVLPEVEHHLSFPGAAEFFVEFWRAQPRGGAEGAPE